MESIEIRFKIHDKGDVHLACKRMFRERGWSYPVTGLSARMAVAELILHSDNDPEDDGYEVVEWD